MALGAVVIEKHFTLSKEGYGPDAALALEPDELEDLVEGIREIETMLAESRSTRTTSSRSRR